jgi:hypothetical protein
MTYHDKTQLTLIIIASPDQAAEGDRLFKSQGLGWSLRTTVPGRKLC